MIYKRGQGEFTQRKQSRMRIGMFMGGRVWSAGVGHLGFFKIFILRKIATNITEISRKHVFATLNRNIIKNRV